MTEQQIVSAYFTYCKLQKNLDNKTLKAYQIDLKQFVAFYPKPTTVTRTDMELYIDEYIDLCCFAKKVGAHYVLMNPLSPFGRGVKTQQLAYTNNEMCLLKKQTELLATDNFQIVYIRFPNNEQKPIGKCPIGSVLYVFTNGDVAICPYMVFAANGENRYNAKDFILGNIFGNEELDLSTEIKKFIKHYLMQNTAYKNCGACSKGCYAIKISNDQDLSDCDFDICPLAGSKTK